VGVSIKPSFWAGKRVFLTGHTGFKGSWLATWLHHLGARVHGFALAPDSTPNLFEVARVADKIHSTLGDIRDLPALRAAMSAASPDIVIHMAAQALVRRAYREPVQTYATNIMGSVHVLEAVRHTPSVRAVVMVTSDKCYDNRNQPIGYRESDPMGGFDPYSSSKGCAELVTAAYRNAFFPPDDLARHGVAVASARAGNVIGGGDWAEDRLIPDIFRAVARGEPVLIRHPRAIRPWQHVLEPLSGYLTLAEKLHDGEAMACAGWNFGPLDTDAQPVESLVRYLIDKLGPPARWVQDNALGPHEAHALMLDCTAAHTRLGWHPRWSLATALDHVIAWHQAHASGEDIQALMRVQIESYCSAPGLMPATREDALWESYVRH
jgi:CDP-glucose 4,6-dehydratase